jgi:hypothetical protein
VILFAFNEFLEVLDVIVTKKRKVLLRDRCERRIPVLGSLTPILITVVSQSFIDKYVASFSIVRTPFAAS